MACSTNAQKADVLRYEVLYAHGGVYLDTDVEYLRNIEPLLAGCDAFIGEERPDEGGPHYGNAVIEFRNKTAQGCILRGRTVVLADGIAGADALAAGWWTSEWQVPVLLTGERGTGKQWLARAIHFQSALREKNFVALDCKALPADALAAVLFGDGTLGRGVPAVR